MQLQSFQAITVLSALSFLSGCASLPKALSARDLQSHPEISAVILQEPYSFRTPSGIGGHELLTLPAGRYAPSQEDDKGVYYYAPSQTVARGGFIPGAGHGRGGIYLTRATPPQAFYFRVGEESLLPYIDAPNEPLDTSRMRFERLSR
jgi:hypothetical protein